MKLSVTFGAAEKKSTDIIIISLFENIKKIPSDLNALDKASGKAISSLLQNGDFNGKLNETILIPTDKKIAPKRVLLVGLGKSTAFSLDKARQAAGTATRVIQEKKYKNPSLLLYGTENKEISLEDVTRSVVEGILLSLYTFTMYKTLKKEEKTDITNYSLIVQKKDDLENVKSAVQKSQIEAEAVCFSRDIVNMAGSDATPTFLANKAKEIAKKTGVKCKVLSIPEMKKLGMNGILNVSRGSSEPPKFIILEYNSKKNTNDTIVLVGKGVTFDSGGISLKPGAGMDLMKADMSGAAAVLGTFKAISDLKPSSHIVGLIPCTENMPGGRALKPGDIIKYMSGKTVEILNTDAEGRLILADAISYAKKYKPDAMIDIATLTGACVAALGTFASGMLGNNEELKDRVKQSGENCHERVWELPLWEEYNDLIKSNIADIKNTGGKYAGTITAACFLAEFVEDFPWVHLDIAGTFLVEKDTPYIRKGATGVGVRLLTHLVMNWKKMTDASKKK
ncbi:leucyl aminopeptidase [Candidatus Scalindua japonica]|uniref:Probable cytosol aminopeptidase n=1 Tax=Candidatus Scalindua japonica TaxID=1284222 RepID=A0A286U3K6_9BACT|nr:leucyl aminopeptidase [Candidatus Scalindua japonica]GAX62740.1 leucyl aminopeptidase [Candidatus Scalindua japonica]